MTDYETDLSPLFRDPSRGDTRAAGGCTDACPEPAAILDLVRRDGPPDETLLARVAACASCSAALQALLGEAGVGEGSRRDEALPSLAARRRWFAAAAAVAAVLLVAIGFHLLSADGSAFEVQHDGVVFYVEGAAWRDGRRLSTGDALARGARLRLDSGARAAVLTGAGRLVVFPHGDAPLALEPLAGLARDLGAGRKARRRRVERLVEGDLRARRPEFEALAPRGGLRSDRPAFRFRVGALGPDERLILKVEDEHGTVALEHRFTSAGETAYPADQPALERGKQYIWNVFHPRSGPGSIGGQTFKVLDAAAVAAVVEAERRLDGLSGRVPVWAAALLRAAVYHHHGLHSEALEALPQAVPTDGLAGFLLEERALLLDRLGLNERIGELKKRLGLDR